MKLPLVLLLCLLFSAAIGSPVTPKGFAQARGTMIVDGEGRPLLLRGINLGNWFVPEGYMWRFKRDESGHQIDDILAEIIGEEAVARFWREWRERYIAASDIRYLRRLGFNSVRVPLHHKLLFGGEGAPEFAGPGWACLDRLIGWCRAEGIYVLLDLHAAPGCQNGFDNGGIKDVCEWHTQADYREHSLSVLERLAERYRDRPALHAIEVLNEPRWDVPTDYLTAYNADAYARIRRHCGPQIAVVFHDGFRSHREYIGVMQPPAFEGVVFDIHRYQCFERADLDMDIHGHIRKSAGEWRDEADTIRRDLRLPTWVGEWSLGLDLKVVSLWAPGPYNHALEHMDALQENAAYRAYAAAQLLSFERLAGWFFWSYKTETTPAWCFRDCVERGWLPDDFRA